jgi:ribose transport system substrate-binding protein
VLSHWLPRGSWPKRTIELVSYAALLTAGQHEKYAAEADQIVGWAHGDYGQQFTAQFARDNGLVGKFSNGGFDLLDAVLAGIKAGEINWAIGQNPYAQGWVTASLIHMKLENGYDPSDFLIEADLVTAENIDAVIPREAVFKQ